MLEFQVSNNTLYDAEHEDEEQLEMQRKHISSEAGGRFAGS